MQKRSLSLLLISLLLIFSTILWACDPVQEPPVTEPAPTIELPTVVVSTTAPEILPTATEVPSPISVNGESIPLTYYQNEVLRYRDSLTEQTVQPAEPDITKPCSIICDHKCFHKSATKWLPGSINNYRKDRSTG